MECDRARAEERPVRFLGGRAAAGRYHGAQAVGQSRQGLGFKPPKSSFPLRLEDPRNRRARPADDDVIRIDEVVTELPGKDLAHRRFPRAHEADERYAGRKLLHEWDRDEWDWESRDRASRMRWSSFFSSGTLSA